MTTSVWKFLWKYLSKLKVLYFSVLLAVLAGEFFVRLSMYYASKIVDLLSSSGPRYELMVSGLTLAALASVFLLAKGLLLNVVIFIEARFLPIYMSRISKDLFTYAHQHSTAFFAEEMAGNISGKIKTIIDDSYTIYYNILWGFISPCIAVLISFAFIWNINISLSLIMLILNILVVWALYQMSHRLAPYSETRAKMMSEANGALVDSISNAALVKNFSNYLYEKKHYFAYVRKAAVADRLEGIKFGWLFVSQGVLRAVMQAVFYALPVWYWYKGEINIGQFVLIQSLITVLSNIYNMLSMNFINFFKLYGGIKDGLRLLSRPFEVTDAKGASVLNVKNGRVDFNGVVYHYKYSEPLFNGFNLNIGAKEKIGLVGRSGSGKSTLIKLLSRYYDIQGGSITVDDQNIADVTQESLRRSIALIPQDPSLFNRTIMENIRYGNLQASDEEVFEAAKRAYIHDFIISLPEGYNSKVGERGVMLSGGERQRIAIARAVLKNAPILILDEATSALDSESEKFIQTSIRDLMKDKTVIAVAHRLSTLKEMDRIVVMDKGEIVEVGTHASLIRKKGLYHSFYDMQSKGFLKIDDTADSLQSGFNIELENIDN